MQISKTVMTGAFCALLFTPARAQDAAAVSSAAGFIFDTGLFLAAGLAAIVVLIGFCMRDVGLAHAQNTQSVCLRILGLFAVSAFAFWLAGYNLIYTVERGGLLGEFQIWAPHADEAGETASYAESSFWFFQMMLSAVAAAIVSSAVSERVRLWPFLIFAAWFGALIYPIAASWIWGGGYFSVNWRFYDYGGAGAVHIVAGAAALAAAIIVGPRPGKYADGSAPAATELSVAGFGAGLILFGWLIVLAAMGHAFSSIDAAMTVATIIVNAVLAVSGGVVAALFLTQVIYKRAGLVTALCGAVGGLVSISGDPAHPALWQSAMIGAVGGVIVTVAPPFLDRYRIDDAGFVIPVHLLCGAWGVVIVPWTNPDAWIFGQVAGAAGVFVFSFFMSLLVWVALKYTIGVRVKAGGG